jgi:glycosyltransferase involved in cell wall biosynthesis
MNRKPTIVMVIPDLKGNGAERVVLTLATGFEQQGCNVHIVVFHDFMELESGNTLNIHEFKHHHRWIPKSIRGRIIAPILDRFITHHCGKPDLVLSNLMPVDRILCHSGLPNTFLVLHNTIGKELLDNLPDSKKRREISRLSAIYTKKPTISVSKGVKQDFDKIFNAPLESRHIYNPIDIDFIHASSMEHSPKISGYLIHVGKFKHQKRHDILIKTYHRSGVKNPLVLVGQGPLQKDAEELVNSLGLNGKVIFAGFKANPYPLIKHADLMVFSSEYEGLGLVILESLVLGTPVISTDCESGPREMLPKKNLVPVNDIEEFAIKLSTAIADLDNFKSEIHVDFLLTNVTRRYLKLIR